MKKFLKKDVTKPHGFTIVELLIVIVVIGIIAAISIVAFNGVQQRARDTARITDMKNLAKSLELYALENDTYPVRSPSASSWATSDVNPDDYISGLAGPDKDMKKLPLDPVNNATYRYEYYLYGAGSNACDVNMGRYYVIVIRRMESVPRYTAHKDSPGFKCGTRDWNAESGGAAWVQGAFFR